jgi:hypothetical protein
MTIDCESARARDEIEEGDGDRERVQNTAQAKQ